MVQNGVMSVTPPESDTNPAVTPGETAARLLNDIQRTEKLLARRRRIAVLGAIALIIASLPILYWITNPDLTLPTHFNESASPREQSGKGAASPTESLPKSGDPIQRDLTQYLTADLPASAPYERAALEAYQETTGVGYKSDTESARVIREKVLPEYHLYLSRLKSIQPKTPEVKQLHQEYVTVAENRFAAFNAIGRGAGKENGTWKKEVEGFLTKVQTSDARYHSLLTELLVKHQMRTLTAPSTSLPPSLLAPGSSEP